MDNQYTKLAKQAIVGYLNENKIIKPDSSLPSNFLNQKAGVFVSFKDKGELRGCIGTFLPTQENIALEIINNSIAAGTQDPRFNPLSIKEIDDLSISVDVLSSPVITNKNDLDVKKYGVLVKADDGRSGLLLPDLEGVDSVEQQIEIACQKAGILLTEDFKISKFTVQRHGKK